MPGLLIKDLPPKVHARLKARARAHRRSLSSEALILLEAALTERAGPPTLEEIDRLRIRGQAPLTDAILEAALRSGRP